MLLLHVSRNSTCYGHRGRGHYILPLNLFIFYFVNIDKRPGMGSQPKLASRSEVVSIYKCPTKSSGARPKNVGRKKRQIFDHFFRDFRTRHRISPERNVASTNQNANVNLQSTMCSQQGDLLSVTFDPETAEIHLLIVTHLPTVTVCPTQRPIVRRSLNK